MLERVTPSAECAAHIFLRRFEAPVRSHRHLDRAFWRHGYEYSEASASAWWPSYLDSIRSRSRTTPYNSQLPDTHVNYNAPVAPRCRTSRPKRCDTRAFTIATGQKQTASAQAILEDSTETEEKQIFEQTSNISDTVRTARRINGESTAVDLRFAPPSSRSRSTHLNKAWKDFIQSGRKQEQAAPLLRSLVESGTPVELERALKTFGCIPKGQRTAADFNNAIQAAIRLDRNSVVIQTIKESISRRLNPETYYSFLALCVSKGLWNTAANLWDQVGRVEIESLYASSHEPGSRKRNFAGRFATCFDAIVDLPSKLVNLADRLKNNDSVIAAKREHLVELCKKLVVVAVESERIIGSVTSQGLLSLFTIQQQLRFDAKLHFAALATIGHLEEKGTKSRLALLIYRNFRFVYPDAFIPKWVFGTTITICSAARESPETYRSLLEDYKKEYGTAEDGIYFQVMRACANQGEVGDLEAVFDDFCKHSKPKTTDDLHPLIRAHAVTGNAERAQTQFEHIQTHYGFKPNVKTWNALLLAYSRSSTPSLVFDKFKEMETSGIRPDSHSWSILVAAAAKKGDTHYARVLVEQARKVGIPAPLPMTGAVVDSYLMNNKPREAWTLVLSATQRARLTDESPVRLWNSLLRYFAFKSDSDAILRIQEKMKELGVKADSMTYAALMTALVVQGRTQDAAQILRSLHFSQVLSANEFHYSILIHGFGMEKKHDAATVVYHEMLERFPRTTLSAKLSMLYLQANRDEEKARTKQLSGTKPTKPDFRPSLDLIGDIIQEIRPSDRASPIPNPGFRRLSGRNDADNIYFRSLVMFLQRNNAQTAARQVLEATKEHQSGDNIALVKTTSSWVASVESLSQELEMASSARDWCRVSSLWDQIIELTLQNSVSVNATGRKTLLQAPSLPGIQNVEYLGDGSSQFSSMIPQKFSSGTTDLADIKVLPAHQYILSRSISRYIQALDKQHKYAEMVETIRRLHSYKFSLSSKNWNSFIQCLCRSPSPDHQFLAYEIFEKYLLPNTPSWEVIRRGKWVLPSEERPRNEWDKILKKKDHRKDRTTLEKVDPGLLMPSYYTLIHLAIVWLKASRASFRGDHTLKRRLEEQTAGTVRLVLKVPYLRDRVQGLLLRGRSVIGDRTKRPRQDKERSRFAGVQGSTLLIDQLSPEILADIEPSLATRQAPITTDDLPLAEHLFGEIQRSPIVLPSKARMESEPERQARIRTDQQRKLASLAMLLEEIRQDPSRFTPSVGTISRGQAPYLPTSALAQNDTSAETSPQSISATFSKVRSVLTKLSKKAMHKPSALSVYSKETLVRSSSLTRRQTLRMYSPANLDGLVATPRRRLRPRLRARKAERSAAALKATDFNLPPQTSATKRAQKVVDANEMYLARLARLSKMRYHLESVKASGKLTTSKKAIERLNWYKHNFRRLSHRLFASRLRKKRFVAGDSERITK